MLVHMFVRGTEISRLNLTTALIHAKMNTQAVTLREEKKSRPTKHIVTPDAVSR